MKRSEPKSVNVAEKATPEYLELVNELLSPTREDPPPPEVAYAIGVLSALAWNTEFASDRDLLQAADHVTPSSLLEQIDDIFLEWEVEKIVRKPRRGYA